MVVGIFLFIGVVFIDFEVYLVVFFVFFFFGCYFGNVKIGNFCSVCVCEIDSIGVEV